MLFVIRTITTIISEDCEAYSPLPMGGGQGEGVNITTYPLPLPLPMGGEDVKPLSYFLSC